MPASAYRIGQPGGHLRHTMAGTAAVSEDGLRASSTYIDVALYRLVGIGLGHGFTVDLRCGVRHLDSDSIRFIYLEAAMLFG